MAYDPIPDSNVKGRKLLVMQLDPATGPLIVIEPGECWCGCYDPEQPQRPKRNRRFLPGHDNKFRGILQRAHRAGVPVTLVVGGERFEHSAEWWWEERQLGKESAAVRRREARQAQAAVSWLEATQDMSDEDVERMLTDQGLDGWAAMAAIKEQDDKVLALVNRQGRRFTLG